MTLEHMLHEYKKKYIQKLSSNYVHGYNYILLNLRICFCWPNVSAIISNCRLNHLFYIVINVIYVYHRDQPYEMKCRCLITATVQSI